MPRERFVIQVYDWICFTVNNRLVIGQVQYLKVNGLNEMYAITTEGSVHVDQILEVRRQPEVRNDQP